MPETTLDGAPRAGRPPCRGSAPPLSFSLTWVFLFAVPPFGFPVWIWFARVSIALICSCFRCTGLGFFLLPFCLSFLLQLRWFFVAVALWVDLSWNHLAEMWPSPWNRWCCYADSVHVIEVYFVAHLICVAIPMVATFYVQRRLKSTTMLLLSDATSC